MNNSNKDLEIVKTKIQVCVTKGVITEPNVKTKIHVQRVFIQRVLKQRDSFFIII